MKPEREKDDLAQEGIQRVCSLQQVLKLALISKCCTIGLTAPELAPAHDQLVLAAQLTCSMRLFLRSLSSCPQLEWNCCVVGFLGASH